MVKVLALIERGADIDCKALGSPSQPLRAACALGHVKLASLLFAHGAQLSDDLPRPTPAIAALLSEVEEARASDLPRSSPAIDAAPAVVDAVRLARLALSNDPPASPT